MPRTGKWLKMTYKEIAASPENVHNLSASAIYDRVEYRRMSVEAALAKPQSRFPQVPHDKSRSWRHGK